ncbi:hypothetical protein RND71_022891 [Anisodus tanguticus]|uniref:Uncharacterized protein n=1 Tax=Anisodus tanguticus TaxID=243964 RepID=A0AAE1VB46_9SOLA|nr:hypothetical protein RND71_022891 [Anisodus tanguticus]
MIVGRLKSIQCKATFDSLVSSWPTPFPHKHPPAQGGTRIGLLFSTIRRPLPPSLTSPRAFFAPPSSEKLSGLPRSLNFMVENVDLLRAICQRLTTGNRRFRRASHRNTKTYCPLPTIWLEPLGRLYRINNHSCTEYGRIPQYGHLGSPSEGDSHIILARAGEASMGKAPYPYNCLPPMLRNPFQV